MHSAPNEPWYQEGLRFECTRCGNCCTGAPGFVWVSPEELVELARLLNLPVETVRALYTRAASRGPTLREKANGDCIFFDRARPGRSGRARFLIRKPGKRPAAAVRAPVRVN